MKKIITFIIVVTALVSLFSTVAFATDGENLNSEEANLFSTLYNEIAENSDKIFSLLSFLGSLLLIITYRKGMLPILRGGISSLSSGVSSLKEEAKKSEELSESELKCAVEKLDAAENILASLSDRLERLNGELEAAKEEQKKNSDIKVIIAYQIDMLYEIFMSSSLPVYQKEAVGEKISAMKERLSALPEGAENE